MFLENKSNYCNAILIFQNKTPNIIKATVTDYSKYSLYCIIGAASIRIVLRTAEVKRSSKRGKERYGRYKYEAANGPSSEVLMVLMPARVFGWIQLVVCVV